MWARACQLVKTTLITEFLKVYFDFSIPPYQGGRRYSAPHWASTTGGDGITDRQLN